MIIVPPLAWASNWNSMIPMPSIILDAMQVPLLKISCSDTWVIEQMIILVAVFALIITLVCVFVSYTYIIRTILRFPSVQQRKKACSTCSSHMIVVSTMCGSFFICVRPRQRERWPSAHHSVPFVEPLHLHPEE